MSAAPLIRPLAPDEVALAVNWAAQEGWNPGLCDADAFLAQDPEGFLGLFVDDALAVTISAVTYEGRFGFIGFYICRPDLRGRGLGLQVWNAAMARLDGLTVGLDGVVAQQANYARSGFQLAHRNIRYGGPTPQGATAAGIETVGPSLLEAVAAYDRGVFLFPRPAFLARWLAPPEGRALAILKDGALRGYGAVRRCREGFKVGPLFAETAEEARALFLALAQEARGREEGAPIFLDVPEPNGEGRALAEAMGLSPVFETARMYRGVALDLPLSRIFGISTFELG